MMRTIKCVGLNDDSRYNIKVDLRIQCPNCEMFIDPNVVSCISIENNSSSALSRKQNTFFKILITAICQNCYTPITYIYKSYNNNFGCLDNPLLMDTFPKPQFQKKFSEKIKNLSPNFIKIYNQAYLSEQFSLDEICGIGYRKSLEFLIKDFAIKYHPDDEEEIKCISLSACISKYIDSPRLRTLATASAWIGNDETHYIRKHEDYNIEHLKIFIDSTVAFIYEEETLNLATEMIQNNK